MAVCMLLLGMLTAAVQAQENADRMRLILKDGSYQVVLSYTVRSDTVRFHSAERGDWEQVPAQLVDWTATVAYNHEHALDSDANAQAEADASSPAGQAAAALDRQERAQRADERARQPEVAPGLRLPDESGVWGFDTYQDTPELVRIRQSDGDLNLDMGHSVKAAAIPKGGAKELIRLDGYKAAVSFHVARPVFYIALQVRNEPPPREDAMVVDTHGAAAATADKTEGGSPDTTYVAVRLEVVHGERMATGSQLRPLAHDGSPDGQAEVVSLEKRILPGGHWMRVTPSADLSLGQYSLIEVLPGGGWNMDGWDFGVNPMAPENKGAHAPLSSAP